VHYDHARVIRKGNNVVQVQESASTGQNQHHTKIFQNADNVPANFMSASGSTIDISIPTSRYILQSCLVEFTFVANSDTVLGSPYWCSDVSILANSNS
jgi:hypothetical protein